MAGRNNRKASVTPQYSMIRDLFWDLRRVLISFDSWRTKAVCCEEDVEPKTFTCLLTTPIQKASGRIGKADLMAFLTTDHSNGNKIMVRSSKADNVKKCRNRPKGSPRWVRRCTCSQANRTVTPQLAQKVIELNLPFKQGAALLNEYSPFWLGFTAMKPP